MNVLVACEESQRGRGMFKKKMKINERSNT